MSSPEVIWVHTTPWYLYRIKRLYLSEILISQEFYNIFVGRWAYGSFIFTNDQLMYRSLEMVKKRGNFFAMQAFAGLFYWVLFKHQYPSSSSRIPAILYRLLKADESYVANFTLPAHILWKRHISYPWRSKGYIHSFEKSTLMF